MTSLETVKFVAAALTRLSCIHSFSKASCADYDLLFLCQGAAAVSVAVALTLLRKTYTSADGFAATNTLRVASVRSSHLGKSMLRSLSQRASTSLRASHAAQTSRFYSGMAAAASAQPGLHEAGLPRMHYPCAC